MRDFFDSLGLLVMITICMILCAIALPIGLLAAAVWGPVEGGINFCRNVCKLRDWK